VDCDWGRSRKPKYEKKMPEPGTEVILRVGENSLCAECCGCLVNAVGGMNQ
jgi:hypothetical protein